MALLFVSTSTLLLYRYRLHRNQRRLAEVLVTHQRNQAIVDASGEGVLELDTQGKVVFSNPAAARLLGYESEELQGMDYRQLMSSGGLSETRDSTRIGYTTDMLRGIGANLHCKNGRLRPVEYRMVALRHNGQAGSLIAFKDFTERARVDVMLADMQHLAKVGAWEWTVDATYLSLSEGIRRHLGWAAARHAEIDVVLSKLSIVDRFKIMRSVLRAIRTGNGFDEVLMLPTQPTTWVRCIGKTESVQGKVIRVYGTLQDVSERKRTEHAVRETRDFFGRTLDAIPALVLHINSQMQLTYYNHSELREWFLLNEYSLGHALIQVFESLDQAQVIKALMKGVRRAMTGQEGSHVDTIVVKDHPYQAHFGFIPQLDSQGNVAGCFLVVTDVSEMKLLEARVVQAEKMQAVGQLTGGVAHDFNNLLGVVLGNLQLIERDVKHDVGLSKKVNTAMRATMRGAELTKNLLTFARKQMHEPIIIDLNTQLPVFMELIQRTLDDTIEMRLQITETLWTVKADLGQLENAILNLVINARDAMPQGGRLTLTAHNVPFNQVPSANQQELTHDNYVVVRVSDNGMGMPKEILSRVCEPFFTTKDTGKGSGLGLAMVHGFAKQSGGTIHIDSEVGKGTVINLYLPQAKEVTATHEDTLLNISMPGGKETILVVEDDTDLRATTTLNLHRLGYNVLEACNGSAALRILEDSQHVDMLFTDVIMPGGVLGSELAQRARKIKPGIQVLLTTGYMGDATLSRAGSLQKEEVLAKPYRNEQLALKLRYMLDAS